MATSWKSEAASADKIIADGHEKAIELARARCNITSKQIDEKQRELSDYEAETIKVIRGQSKLSIDLLNDLVAECQGLRQTEPDIYVTPITKENRPA